MTISTATRKAGPYAGNDVASAFAFAFKVFANSDLAVTHADSAGVETTLVLDTDYSVSLNADQNANPGGTVTYLAGTGVATALPSGESLTITSDVPQTQETNLANGGPWLPEVIENALDKLTILFQELLGKVNRAVRQPISDSAAIGELPTKANRAGKYFAFDAVTGDPVASSGTADSGLLRDDLASAAAGKGASLVEGSVRRFENVADMVAATGLSDGQRLATNGYYSTAAQLVPDGGGANYVYRATSTATADGGSVLAATGMGAGRMHLVGPAGLLNAKQFGAKGDSSTDNASVFTAMWGAAASGDVIYFPPASGTYRTTSPLPIKNGVSVVGEPGTVVEYLNQAVGKMIDDGNVAMTIDFRGLTFRRSGDGTALSGAEGSTRYTVYQRNAGSVFRFWNCQFDDSNWNITDGATGALIGCVCEGTSYFYDCRITGVGYGIFTSAGTVYFRGNIKTATKTIANHGGTVHANGRFEATDATATGRGTFSILAGTIYCTGDVIRSGDAIAPAIYNTGGTVYATGNIKSAGIGLQLDNASALTHFTGSIYAVASNAITISNGTCRAVGEFVSEQSNCLGVSGGTLYANGTVYAPYTAVGSKNGLQISGGLLYFKGSIAASGSGISMTAGEAWVDALMDYTAVNNHAVAFSGGTLKLDGRIETELNGINITGSTVKTLDIGNLDIRINGANTARRGIEFGSSTGNTVRASSLRISVPAGAAQSISTNAANAQTITAGKIMASVGISADVTVSAFTYAAP